MRFCGVETVELRKLVTNLSIFVNANIAKLDIYDTLDKAEVLRNEILIVVHDEHTVARVRCCCTSSGTRRDPKKH